MSKVYYAYHDFDNYSSFIELFDDVDKTFFKRYFEWKNIDLLNYEPIKFKLYRTDSGKFNYQFDITINLDLIILSEKAVEVLKDILEKKGQIIPIVTPSKRKKFFGFYPNKNVYDESIINLNKSTFNQCKNGKNFSKIVLNNKYPKDDYLFVIKDGGSNIFFTDKFKKLLEDNNLKGLEFSKEIKVED